MEAGWILLRKNPPVWHGQVLPPTICCTTVSSYTGRAWQLFFTFMNLIWITMCQVQQELNRFFIWYQIRQVSVGCGELSPWENNRPMILRNHPIQPFFLLFSLLTSEDSRIWRKNMVTYKFYPVNVWYGVLQTLHSFSRLLDALLLLSGKIGFS